MAAVLIVQEVGLCLFPCKSKCGWLFRVVRGGVPGDSPQNSPQGHSFQLSPKSLFSSVFFDFCQLAGGVGFVPFVMLYNKLSAFGTWDFSREFELFSLSSVHVWTSFVQGTLKTLLKTRPTNNSNFSSSSGMSHSSRFLCCCKQNHFHAFTLLCLFTFSRFLFAFLWTSTRFSFEFCLCWRG